MASIVEREREPIPPKLCINALIRANMSRYKLQWKSCQHKCLITTKTKKCSSPLLSYLQICQTLLPIFKSLIFFTNYPLVSAPIAIIIALHCLASCRCAQRLLTTNIVDSPKSFTAKASNQLSKLNGVFAL